MKTLVTGAHGFIGSHLCDALLAAGHSVRALVSPWGQLHKLEHALAHPALEVVRGDITAPDTLRGHFEGVEVVFHSAARAADWGRAVLFERANLLGTQHVLEAAQGAGVRRLVHVSSVAVHRYRGHRGADPRAAALDGDINPYAVSKRQAEALVRSAEGIEVVVVRPGLWPFGARDDNFARMAKFAAKGQLPIVGSGEAVINMAYVENLAQGLRLAGEVPEAAGRLYLIADEGAPSWAEAFEELARLLAARPSSLRLPVPLISGLSRVVEGLWKVAPGAEPPLTLYRARLMEKDVHFHFDAAQAELGYAPTVSWREGMRRAVEALQGGRS